MMVLIAAFMVASAAPAQAEEKVQTDDSRAAVSPGMAVLAGGGPYYSVPCGCVDRGVWSVHWLGRLYFGDLGALEAGAYTGTMLLGGRFPSRGWSAGAQVLILPQSDERWWDGLSAKSGYRRWQISGMRASGANGIYGGLNWSVEVLPHVHVEADATANRAFRTMSHWSFEGSLGIGFRL